MIDALKRSPALQWAYRLPILVGAYHLSLAFLGALLYGFPSRKLYIIGVTGTKGKTTTCSLIADILSGAGHKTGLITTVKFAIGDREWVNDTKQTMPGRFGLQKILRDMVRAGCEYAVIETSSEGILQHRHRFINYKAAVFTNLSPEHIERHGGFENYRAAKLKLFKAVAKRPDGVGVYNLDDENAIYFLGPSVEARVGFGKKEGPSPLGLKKFLMSGIKLGDKETRFKLGGESYTMPLLGEFNVYNAAAAICTALSQNISVAVIKNVLQSARGVSGRMEVIEARGIRIVVDYAHEPASLTALYEAVKIFKPRRVIGILGSQGGGRDKWKRAAMGKVAAKYCDELILTNEDPYDEDPLAIIEDIEKGVLALPTTYHLPPTTYKVVDRREAIGKAISLAKKGDVVVISGKGGEVVMCVEGGRKIPWSDKNIVEGFLGL